MQEGLINTYKESGFFPEWASPGHRDCMIGNNSASFLRIQNIALGYTLPKNWLKKLKIENARIYANIKNVYTFTGYDGYDPEIGSTQAQYSYSGQSMLMYGVDTGRCPSPRIYTFGIDLTF